MKTEKEIRDRISKTLRLNKDITLELDKILGKTKELRINDIKTLSYIEALRWVLK